MNLVIWCLSRTASICNYEAERNKKIITDFLREQRRTDLLPKINHLSKPKRKPRR